MYTFSSNAKSMHYPTKNVGEHLSEVKLYITSINNQYLSFKIHICMQLDL